MVEARQKDLGALDRNLLYVQVEQRIEDLLVRKRHRLGDRIPLRWSWSKAWVYRGPQCGRG